MAYFQGATPVGQMPPQAAVNGLGQMPPQAAVNGPAIGMMPPQAQAGLGQGSEAETPALVPGQNALPQGPLRSWRDGVLGDRRKPQPFGERLRPFKDGIFGPSLALGQTNGGPPLEMTPEVIAELQDALAVTVGSYSAPDEPGKWGAATAAAYVTYVEEQTPGYDDKGQLYVEREGKTFPSARGVYVLMQGAKQQLRAEMGAETGEQEFAARYPLVGLWMLGYDDAGMQGKVILPKKADRGDGEDVLAASNIAMWGIGAALVGVAFVAFSRRKRRR